MPKHGKSPIKRAKPKQSLGESRPQPGQIEAIHKLVRQGEVEIARLRVKALQHGFPHFKPLFGLAYEVEEAAGNPVLAPLAAWDWSRASPNSLAAWEALCESAGFDFAALALTARRRADELAGLPPAPEPIPQMTPFGKLSLDEATRLDLCRLLLSAERLEEAEAMATGIDHVSARNNHALVVFARGRIEEALHMLEDNWRAAPANLFAVERIIRLRLWLHGRDAVAGLAAPLMAATALRADDVNAKLAGLLLLDRFAEAESAYRKYADAEWWHGGQETGWFHYLGAYAAWRQGNSGDAVERLEEAIGSYEDFEAADEALEALSLGLFSGDQPDWQIGDFGAWWPLAGLRALRQLGKSKLGAGPTPEDLGLAYPDPDYLQAMVEKSGNGMRALALLILKQQAEAGEERARQSLSALLALPCGPDSVRLKIHQWLVEHAILSQHDTARVLLTGKLQEVHPTNIEIHAEPQENSELAPEDQAHYEEMFAAIHRGELDKALGLMQGLHDKYPDSPRILANLAAIKNGLKHPRPEWEPLVRRAFEIDPDYLFARTLLTHLYVEDGQLEEARRLLEPLAKRERMHISEWRAYSRVQYEIAVASGDMQAAFRALQLLQQIEERFGE